MRFLYSFLIAIIVVAGGCRRSNSSNCCGSSCSCGKAQSALNETNIPAEHQQHDQEHTHSELQQEQQQSDDHISQAHDAASSPMLEVKGGPKGRLITRKAYITSYNATTRQPNWVAWTLTAAHTDGNLKYRNFSEDNSLPEPRATLDDYRDSGYSRGHICPAGDNKWDETARNETFLLSNICPQDRDLNGGTWNQIEMACREWAKRYGEVHIVSGPIFYSDRPRTIGRNRIAVPDAFFKVIARGNGDSAHTIAFVCPNTGNTGKKAQYVTSVTNVEKATGMTFFPTLPSSAKSQSTLDTW